MKKSIKSITLLSILMLFTTMVNAKKVKEIDGVKIPKGYVATYDDLEDRYQVIQKTDMFSWAQRKTVLMMSFVKVPSEFVPVIVQNYWGTQPLRTSSSTIYIRNKDQDLVKHSSEWNNRESSRPLGRESIVESHTFIDPVLNTFLFDNLQEDSEVIVRFFSNTGSYKEVDIPKKYIKQILGGIEFYKSLNVLQ